MPAASHPESTLEQYGALPFALFGYEPLLAEGGEHPIPTQVRFIDRRAVVYGDADAEPTLKLYEQDLSAEGRLVTAALNGHIVLRRRWEDDGSYREEGPNTSASRSVKRIGQHGWQIKDTDEEGAHIEARVHRDGSKTLVTQHKGDDEEVVETKIDEASRVVAETTWANPSEFRDGFFAPIDEAQWHYDAAHQLTLVTSSSHGANGNPRQETYTRTGSTIKVVAFLIPEPQPLIAMEQVRHYDGDGRVEMIQGLHASTDGSSQDLWTAELSYN